MSSSSHLFTSSKSKLDFLIQINKVIGKINEEIRTNNFWHAEELCLMKYLMPAAHGEFIKSHGYKEIMRENVEYFADKHEFAITLFPRTGNFAGKSYTIRVPEQEFFGLTEKNASQNSLVK